MHSSERVEHGGGEGVVEVPRRLRTATVAGQAPMRRAAALALGAVLLSGCTDAAGYDLDYILAIPAFIATMRTTVAYEPQAMPRSPAPGSVPIASPAGDVPAAFTQMELETAGAALTNPLPASPEVLARGGVVYQNQCYICHGAQGEGNGPVVGVGRFPMGPPVNGAMSAGRSDGYLYGVIRVGRGLMPSYGERIGEADRWAVVHFLRDLQQRGGFAPAAPAVLPTPGAAVPPAEPAAPAVEPAAPAAVGEPDPGA